MELDATTFILELINFAVLMWLLKHFFYKPVTNAIEKRRKSIEATLNNAQQRQRDAEAMKHEYSARLDSLEEEYQKREQTLAAALAEKRATRLADIEKDIAAEKKRLQTLFAHQQNEIGRAQEKQAAALSARFVSQLMTAFSGPELEALIIRRLTDELRHLDGDKKQHIIDSTHQGNNTITVLTAYPLKSELIASLQQALSDLTGDSAMSFDYKTSPAVIAGVEMLVNAYRVEASLRGELTFFKEMLHES